MFKEDNPARDIKSAETIIGASVKVEGDFTSDHDIIIDGEVTGNIRTKSNLKIGPGARVKAEINAKNAYIAGGIIGNVTVEEKLQLTSEASIKGNVNATLLMMEMGAKLNGQCHIGDDSKPEVLSKKVEK
ncbi:MAG: polymer-forming cytoskeletal protein [Candidatus Komeilibacteria bacterium]|nr:polymer-forming cytoskeletal protein [Candidatus Komeilibacteria bacterium]